MANDRYCSGGISLSQVRYQDVVLVIMEPHELDMLERREASDCLNQHLRIVAIAGNGTLLRYLPLKLGFHLLETGFIEVAKMGFQF
jgi:hypothetical protein